jgi:hypothetical protein
VGLVALVGLAASVCYGVLIFAVIKPAWRFELGFWLAQGTFAIAFLAFTFSQDARPDGPGR